MSVKLSEINRNYPTVRIVIMGMISNRKLDSEHNRLFKYKKDGVWNANFQPRLTNLRDIIEL